MDIDALRKYCLRFPHTTENVQWGYDLCFKVDGKLFLVTPLEPAPVALSFKCSPENFAELCERPGIRPAPYMARAQWFALEQLNTLPDSELRELVAASYQLVWERLPKKRREELQRRKAGKSAERKVRKPVARKVAARPAKARSKSSKAAKGRRG